jgi:hypothetical protein
MEPVSAAELNKQWASANLPYRLDRRGVAHLWAVYPAAAENGQPLLFIIGAETRAVSQARRWAATLQGGQSVAAA